MTQPGLKKGDLFEVRFTVSKDIYEGFITIFNDRNPLHVEEAFAKEKGFKSVVMHGNILNGFLSYFIGEMLPVKNVIIHRQEIKYHNPVHLWDELNLVAEVRDVHEAVRAVEFKFKFMNRSGVKVASGGIQIGII